MAYTVLFVRRKLSRAFLIFRQEKYRVISKTILSEPFGISPLEAMRAGVPTIISKQSGVAEVLKHSIKVDYWDVDALADAIYGLLAYPALGKMAGEEGLDEVNQLKWENAALKVEEVYKDVLGV